jgi:hypothetical protein
MIMSGLLLGIDVGSYSSKGVLVEPSGNVLKTQVVEHKMSIPHSGWAEQDADAVWWEDVVKICRSLLNGNPYRGPDVGAVAVSAIGPCRQPSITKTRLQTISPGLLTPLSVPPPNGKYIGGWRSLTVPAEEQLPRGFHNTKKLSFGAEEVCIHGWC